MLAPGRVQALKARRWRPAPTSWRIWPDGQPADPTGKSWGDTNPLAGLPGLGFGPRTARPDAVRRHRFGLILSYQGELFESLSQAQQQITVEPMVIWAQHEQEGAQEPGPSVA